MLKLHKTIVQYSIIKRLFLSRTLETMRLMGVYVRHGRRIKESLITRRYKCKLLFIVEGFSLVIVSFIKMKGILDYVIEHHTRSVRENEL